MMNITDIDLLTLSAEAASDRPLDADMIALINRIVFDFGNQAAPEGDVILVPGNPQYWAERASRAVGIWERNPCAFLVLSGGAPNSPGGLTEAEQMARLCADHGVPPGQILTESQSATTVENFLFSAPLIHSLGIPAPRIIAVSSASHMRRVMMNFEKYRSLFPDGSRMIPSQSSHPVCNRDSWFRDAASRTTVALELKFIHAYLYEGNYPVFCL